MKRIVLVIIAVACVVEQHATHQVVQQSIQITAIEVCLTPTFCATSDMSEVAA